MAGLIEVARWWRQRQRQDPRLAAGLPPEVQAAKPRTQLVYVTQTPDGRRFLERRVRELKGTLAECPRREAAEISGSLGSILHLLGRLEEAEAHLESAVKQEGRFACQLERVRRERAARQTLLDVRRAAVEPIAAWETIDRIELSDLSKQDFQRRYAGAGRPVIITGLVRRMFAKGVWTRERLRAELGSKTVVPRHRVPQSPDWASLEDAPASTVSSFLDAMGKERGADLGQSCSGESHSQDPRTRKASSAVQSYLFDWNLPDNAPELCSELSIPAYFADDLLQQLPEGAMYRDAWPSLFVGPRGTRSGLHIDAFGSNFWMAVLEGTKRWKLYRRSDAALLGPSYKVSLDPTFAAERDIELGGGALAGRASAGLDQEGGKERADEKEEHAGHLAGGWDFELSAGEVLFVPAGCPHGVCNLTDSVAISANYVDYSNLALAIAELELACAEDARAKVVLDSLRQRQEEVAGVELDGKEAGGKDTDAAGGGTSAARSSSPGDAQGDSGHGPVPAVSHAVPAESSAAAAPLLVPWSQFKRASSSHLQKRMRL